MNEGFSLLEFMVAMTISLMLLTLIVGQASLLGQRSPKIIEKQDRLEALFNTVDFFKSDMNACGQRLQEAQAFLNTLCLDTLPHRLTLRLGVASETITEMLPAREQTLRLTTPDEFSSGREVLIYDPASKIFEWARIREKRKDTLQMEVPLKQDYLPGSRLVAIKTIAYQHDVEKQTLSRKVDRAPFQPMLEQVKDFYFTFFPESTSMLYQIALSTGEQVRGYISLINLVKP
jgi:prepilin-type N-terminal cleavage/methylation domain-containing protein